MTLSLSGDEVEVFPVHLVTCDRTVRAFEAMLAPDELDRAQRFRADLRASFIVSRGALRTLVGRYLGENPGRVEFTYSRFGKPGVSSYLDLRFSVSHSADIALFAFAAGAEIGVDTEHIRPVSEMMSIARTFCAGEAAELLALPAHDRQTAFFSCWTRKEAYLKATGKGLRTRLDSFRVTLRPGESARLIDVEGDEDASQRWRIADVTSLPAYRAAVAYEGPERQVILRPLTEAAALLDQGTAAET